MADAARILGRRGGRARAARLSGEERIAIASLGDRRRASPDTCSSIPMAAARLAERAARVRIGAQHLRVADERDLLELKRLAAADRDAPGDAEDIAFLERRLKR